MQRRGSVYSGVLCLIMTGLLLARAGWSYLTPRAAAQPPAVSQEDKIREALNTPSAWRWKQGQPNHWRACMLHR